MNEKVYMKFKELNQDQKEQVKVWYYSDMLMEKELRNISYGEIANINNLVKDNDTDFIDYVDMINFVKEDFC